MTACAQLAREIFQPNNDPGLVPVRCLAVGLGLIGLVASIAGQIFGTLLYGESLALGIMSATLIVGGAVGSLGLMALAIIVGLGIELACVPYVSYGYHFVDYVWI